MKQKHFLTAVLLLSSYLMYGQDKPQPIRDSLPDVTYTYTSHESRLQETSVNLYVVSSKIQDSTEVPKNTNQKWKKGAQPSFLHHGFRLEYQTMRSGTWFTDSTKFTRWNHDAVPTYWHVWNSSPRLTHHF